jgi:predicted regulator of Ras-like GTPase activity (Roadblock/LC7/MglB family)
VSGRGHEHPGPVDIRRGISEFGEVLAELVESTPGAWGAVLSDSRGDPIDFAHRRSAISELDLQIAGAQVGQALARLQRTATAHGLGQVDVVIQGSRATLCSAQLFTDYLVTLMLDHDCNIARATERFSRVRASLRDMLR